MDRIKDKELQIGYIFSPGELVTNDFVLLLGKSTIANYQFKGTNHTF